MPTFHQVSTPDDAHVNGEYRIVETSDFFSTRAIRFRCLLPPQRKTLIFQGRQNALMTALILLRLHTKITDALVTGSFRHRRTSFMLLSAREISSLLYLAR